MPTYEYECRQCAKHFEVFHGINEEVVKTCSKCGGRVKLLISGGGGLIFKGSGFYATDYKRTAPPKPPGEKKDVGAEAGGKGNTPKEAQGKQPQASQGRQAQESKEGSKQ